MSNSIMNNNFIEHFYLFGADWNDLFNHDNSIKRMKGTPTNAMNIKPKLLSKFPPINKPNANINSEVIMNVYYY